MNAKQLKAAQAEKDTASLKREIAWLKRHIKVRESVLAERTNRERIDAYNKWKNSEAGRKELQNND